MRAARDGVVVVLTVRADFYGRLAAYPELSKLVGANNVLVGPMSRGELRRAIERPAQRAGLNVEPELADALLADVEGQPGALPLLSTALLELWRERDGRHLRLAAYARSGGVQGAVARLAEDAFLELDAREREVARDLLLGLTDEDEGGAVVRRRAELAELTPEASGVASRLADRRLLTVSDGAVEVAHEALLREWPRLRGWLEEDASGRRLHRRLADAAKAWDADGRDAGGLYRGAALAAALDWAAVHDGRLTPSERDFLQDSRLASGRAQRRLRLVLAGVAAMLVVSVIAGAAALQQGSRAREQATAAAAQRLGAQALTVDALDRSLLLAREGVALDDAPETRGNLFAALLRSPAVIGVLRGGDRVAGVALSPDERTLAYVTSGGVLRFADTKTRRMSGSPATVAQLSTDAASPDLVRYSDDGSMLAVGGFQPLVIDAATHRIVSRPPSPSYVDSVRFSSDGRTLFAGLGGGPQGRADIRAFATMTGGSIRHRFGPRPSGPASLLPTRDGEHVVATFALAAPVVYDADTLQPLRRLPGVASAAALSSDGHTVLLGARDGAVRFTDVIGGRARMAAGRHEGAVVQAAFSGNGLTAATAGEDNRIIVWDPQARAARETLTGHTGRITGLAISWDGRTLYSSSLDGTVLIWDLAGDRRLGRPFTFDVRGRRAAPDGLLAVAMSPNPATLAVGGHDGTIGIVDVERPGDRQAFRFLDLDRVTALAFVPHGHALIAGGESGTLERIDMGAPPQLLPGHAGGAAVQSIVFSSDGRLMATSTFAGAVLLWRMKSGRPAGKPRSYLHPGPMEGRVALSPDGRLLAVGSMAGVDVIEVATLRRIATLPESETVLASWTSRPTGAS